MEPWEKIHRPNVEEILLVSFQKGLIVDDRFMLSLRCVEFKNHLERTVHITAKHRVPIISREYLQAGKRVPERLDRPETNRTISIGINEPNTVVYIDRGYKYRLENISQEGISVYFKIESTDQLRFEQHRSFRTPVF